MDYLNIPRVIPKVVDEVFSQLLTEYRKVSPLTVILGRVHDYLGMRMYYGTKSKVRITMPKHIEVVLEAATEDMDNAAKTPETNHVFQVQEDGGMLASLQADLFRNLVAKILFVSFQSRPGLKTALSFFTMQVRNPDQDDYKKLALAIRYTRGTQGTELTLEAESMYFI